MTDVTRPFSLMICLLLALCPCAAAARATISGSVLDNETRQPLEGIEVNIAAAGAQGPSIVAYTNVSGIYSAKVAPGDYEISIKKLSETNIKKTITAEEGKTEVVDFLVGLRNTAKDAPQKQDDSIIFWAAAFLILIAAAGMYMRRKKKKTVTEPPAEEPKKKIPVVASDELSLLKAERDRLKRMMTEERIAYTQRKINEERLKAVISDHERSLEEVKRKISELESS